MSANMPENNFNNQQPIVDETMQEVVTPNDVSMEQVETVQNNTDTQVQDQQVINAVAEGLAEDEINAMDIVAVLLSEAFGVSPEAGYILAEMFKKEIEMNAMAPSQVATEEVQINTTGLQE